MKKLILMIAITLVAFNSWAVDCSYMEERMSRLKSYGIKMNSYANKSIDQYNRESPRVSRRLIDHWLNDLRGQHGRHACEGWGEADDAIERALPRSKINWNGPRISY